jgi:SSS family solute:Na+ symporter
MLWKRATPQGGFWGLLAGTASSIGMYVWVKIDPSAVSIIARSPFAKDQAQNMFRALWCGLICVLVTVVVSLLTKPKSDKELVGLVYGCTEIPSEGDLPWWQRPLVWAGVVAVIFIALQIIFW